MRVVKDHFDGHGLNESIEISASDELNGAAHEYKGTVRTEDGILESLNIVFQRGPRNAKDSIPGMTEMAVLAVVIDRLRSHQAGPYSCRENACALTKCEEALHWMRQRADNRAARGVLGTTQA